MKQYLVNLTNRLIQENTYDDDFHRLDEDKEEFIKHVKFDLQSRDVHEMSPETCGKIMGSFEIGEVAATKEQLVKHLHYGGDCEELLKELVSTCLAYVIWERFEECFPDSSAY